MAEATPTHDADVKCVEKEIKKVRKKLKEIESLQKLDRKLNFDEKEKLKKKDELNEILCQLISECGDLSINSDTTTNSSTYNSFHSDHHRDDHVTSTPIVMKKQIVEEDEEHKGEREGPPQPPPESPPRWCGRSVIITPLQGHNDAVCSVDTNGHILMSGSRDTSIKVWDLHDFCELRSLGFHTDAVTGVKILQEGDELVLGMVESSSEQSNCHFGISASLDCYIVLWNLETGKQIQAIYTYNSIQCFVYSNMHVYTGSDGGKIDAWRMSDGVNTFTLCDCGCGITCMTLEGVWLYCGRTKGSIQVWNIESRELYYDTITEVDDQEVGGVVATPSSTSCIRCICQYNDVIYFGDNGTNIKVLEWKTKDIQKLANHVGDKGSTGGLAVCENQGDIILLSAGFDMATGQSVINVRRLTDGQYLCSVQDGSTSYISCMCATSGDTTPDSCIQVIAGGAELKVIGIHQQHGIDKDLVKLKKGQLLLECTAIDELANNSYKTDASYESDQHDEENSRTLLHVKPLPVARGLVEGDSNSYQNSWCTVM